MLLFKNVVLKGFSLTSNIINIGKYNPYKQKVFGSSIIVKSIKMFCSQNV